MKLKVLHILLSFFLLSTCSDRTPGHSEAISQNGKSYWYNGDAEITSYQLNQARYGEMRNGKAVLVFVTEPFSPTKYVKADHPTDNDVSVLKLNFTKKFTTGIYPYSMMTSTFFPFENGKHSLKISSSSQEWCGNTYMELKNKKKYEIQLNSYFEGESFNKKLLDKHLLEDDIWSIIRLQPDQLPTGEMEVIPSFFYLRFMHKEAKTYSCHLSKNTKGDTVSYSITYPELDRSLTIQFENASPYKIIGWQETYYSGWGNKRKKLTTTATRIKTLKIDYWNKNSNAFSGLRDELGLE